MWIAENWKDYELLDASDGERLERWGRYVLIRPDPQIIWKDSAKHKAWKEAHAVYRRSAKGGGEWVKSNVPICACFGRLDVRQVNMSYYSVEGYSF